MAKQASVFLIVAILSSCNSILYHLWYEIVVYLYIDISREKTTMINLITSFFYDFTTICLPLLAS